MNTIDTDLISKHRWTFSSFKWNCTHCFVPTSPSFPLPPPPLLLSPHSLPHSSKLLWQITKLDFCKGNLTCGMLVTTSRDHWNRVEQSEGIRNAQENIYRESLKYQQNSFKLKTILWKGPFFLLKFCICIHWETEFSIYYTILHLQDIWPFFMRKAGKEELNLPWTTLSPWRVIRWH